MRTRHTRHKGFTLVEVVVAFAIFSLVLGGAVSILTTGIAGQRRALGSQDMVGEISLVTEYVGRALRQARKDDKNSPDGQCLTDVGYGYGWNYQVMDGGTRIRFLDRGASDNDANKRCREIFLEDGQIKEKIAADAQEGSLPPSGVPLTSVNIEVTDMRFYEDGAEQQSPAGVVDNRQPRVTLFIEAKSAKAPTAAPLRVQTTITQRVLDIRR